VIIMAEERTYTIPLRKEWLKAPKYKRAKKAIAGVRKFVIQHMRNENVLIGPKLNLKIWEHGIKNPPHHVKVTCHEDKDGMARVELFGIKFEKKEKKEDKKKASGLMGKVQEKLEGGKEEKGKTEMKSGKKELKEAEKAAEKKPAPDEKKEEKKEEKPADEKPTEKKEEPAPEKPPEEKKE